MSKLRSLRPRHTTVVAYLALFVALGGSAYAVTIAKKNSVTSKSVKNDSLKGADILESSLNLPAGSQGPKGDKGDPGQPGQPGAAGSAPACQGNSADDVMVLSGTTCIDRYEASIWTARTGGTQITAAVPCDPNGQDCTNIYARSVANVEPKANITYFQAQRALANSGKRLPTNAEWQSAAAGNSTDCNTFSGVVASTGANLLCKSTDGLNDIVGNLSEWVADWVPISDTCPGWGAFSNDVMCLSGASSVVTSPGALSRGGSYDDGTGAGPFAVDGTTGPSRAGFNLGFRGAR